MQIGKRNLPGFIRYPDGIGGSWGDARLETEPAKPWIEQSVVGVWIGHDKNIIIGRGAFDGSVID